MADEQPELDPIKPNYVNFFILSIIGSSGIYIYTNDNETLSYKKLKISKNTWTAIP